ncbi:MAG: hypothetical protein COV99_05140 [Bacteroidetes bacterium CG12_big_fil_rev_8_21_14_0_65_60_17]|nr:MAG: hypothetical protein COV99_05140 [Bacteroidetes bacterium CG12_big_fil_rev_8_21_14_0_65_60_17]
MNDMEAGITTHSTSTATTSYVVYFLKYAIEGWKKAEHVIGVHLVITSVKQRNTHCGKTDDEDTRPGGRHAPNGGREQRAADLPLETVRDDDMISAIADRCAYAAIWCREAIDRASSASDEVTGDLFTEKVRGLDKSLRFLEAHTQ